MTRTARPLNIYHYLTKNELSAVVWRAFTSQIMYLKSLAPYIAINRKNHPKIPASIFIKRISKSESKKKSKRKRGNNNDIKSWNESNTRPIQLQFIFIARYCIIIHVSFYSYFSLFSLFFFIYIFRGFRKICGKIE